MNDEIIINSFSDFIKNKEVITSIFIMALILLFGNIINQTKYKETYKLISPIIIFICFLLAMSRLKLG